MGKFLNRFVIFGNEYLSLLAVFHVGFETNNLALLVFFPKFM